MRSHLTEPGMGPASSYVGSLANGILAKLGSLDADPLVNSLSWQTILLILYIYF